MPRKQKFSYSVHPSITMVQSSVLNLEKRTGRTIFEWVELANDEGPATKKERRDWLKTEHGLGSNYASWIAERAEGKGWEDSDPDAYLRAAREYVEAMFSGPKASLRPIYEALLNLAFSLGDDVKACPCKTIVPLYRRHVFAEVKPSTRTRIDFGLALRDTPVPDRLISTGGFTKKDRITHRIPLTSTDQIDDELRRWLRVAYDLDA